MQLCIRFIHQQQAYVPTQEHGSAAIIRIGFVGGRILRDFDGTVSNGSDLTGSAQWNVTSRHVSWHSPFSVRSAFVRLPVWNGKFPVNMAATTVTQTSQLYQHMPLRQQWRIIIGYGATTPTQQPEHQPTAGQANLSSPPGRRREYSALASWRRLRHRCQRNGVERHPPSGALVIAKSPDWKSQD